MAYDPLIKGESDWHLKMNSNMGQLQESADGALEIAQETAATKLPKPIEPELPEGYVFQNADGTTNLVAGGDMTGKFKYTILVDNGDDSNPRAVEYADDCASFIEARVDNLGDWGNTDLIKNYFRPCVIKPGDGAPTYYLQQNNMSLKVDGTPAVLTGADGDVMIEIRKLYGKFTKVGNRAKISVMNYKEDASCFCFNDIGGVEKDVVYRGAYEAGVLSGATTIMRSVSGVAPLVSQTRGVMRGYAYARGAGYHQNNPFMLFLYQLMYLMMYRNRDSQTALGQGRTLSTNTAPVNTGALNTRPFCWGDQAGVNGVKFLGVENFWGNVWELVDGIVVVNQVYKVTRDPSKYDDVGSSYEISAVTGMTAANHTNKYLTQLQLSNDLGFLPKNSGDSASTYWCDNMWTADAVQIAFFGGQWNSAAWAGAFSWHLNDVPFYASNTVGSRLCRA